MASPMEMLLHWNKLTGEVIDAFFPHPDVTRLRMRLLKEEHEEVREELVKFIANPVDGDRGALAKELADMLYVIYGTGVSLGIDLDEALRRVHESNLTKAVNGKVERDRGGKVIKPATYEPPDMSIFNLIDSTAEELPA